MPSRLDEATAMMRANPVRTVLLAVLPLIVVATQIYQSTVALSLHQSLISLTFAGAILVYCLSIFRIHLARHRITALES